MGVPKQDPGQSQVLVLVRGSFRGNEIAMAPQIWITTSQ